MNPEREVFTFECLPPDLSEEMLEELAIMAMEGHGEDEEEPMDKRDAFLVAALVQACILESESHRELRLPPKG